MVCNKLFTAFQDFRFVSSEESIHLHPYNSVSGFFLYLQIELCCFLHFTVHPEDVCLIFQEISVLREQLECFVQETLCFNPVLPCILHQEAALEFHKARMSRIFLQKLIDDLFCLLYPMEFIMIRSFPEKLNIFFQSLHLRTQMVKLLTDLHHPICL